MALTKIGKEGITGISNASDATAITIGSDENVGIGLASTSGVRLEVKTTSSDHLVARFENSHASGSYGISVKAGDDSGNYPADFANKSGTSLMRVRGDGNVGIGTTSPGGKLTIEGTQNSLDSQLKITASGQVSQYIGGSSAVGLALGHDSASLPIVFKTGVTSGTGVTGSGTEHMRITSSGTVLIGKTSSSFSTVGSEFRTAGVTILGRSGGEPLTLNRTSSDGGILNFNRENNGVGSVSVNGSSTAFNTSSDYRLKENVDYTWDATTRLKQLKPARFNFIADDTNTLVDGFIAHEVSSIVPEAITGTKDAMTAQVLYAEGDELPDGKSVGDVKEPSVIKPQGIDQSKLVPLLVKTIQELEARITALEA